MQFSQAALQALESYEENAKAAIDCPLTVEISESNTSQHHQLRFLRSTLTALDHLLE